MIELKNISKDFGSGEKAVHAVRDVSLSIGSRGDFRGTGLRPRASPRSCDASTFWSGQAPAASSSRDRT